MVLGRESSHLKLTSIFLSIAPTVIMAIIYCKDCLISTYDSAILNVPFLILYRSNMSFTIYKSILDELIIIVRNFFHYSSLMNVASVVSRPSIAFKGVRMS
jgi:hypothetical protein